MFEHLLYIGSLDKKSNSFRRFQAYTEIIKNVEGIDVEKYIYSSITKKFDHHFNFGLGTIRLNLALRKLDFSKFDLIYAGAQKNMGPAGTTLVVVREDVLGKVSRKIPSMMDYKVHISKGSMFNTPPVFPVYTSMLNLEWLKNKGGIAAIEKENEKKAQLIYSEIDLNPLFDGFAAKADRSTMNATFTLANDDLKDSFDSMCLEAGINGLNGHRSVGGYRASMYNALTLESVQVLVEIMSELERKA